MGFHLHVQTVGITSRLPPLCCWEPLHECHHWHHRDALGKHSRESSSAIPPWHRRHLVVGERRLGATSYASVSGALTYARPLPATPPPPAAPPRHRQHSPNRNYCHRAQRTPTPQGGRRAGRSTRRGRGKFVIVTRLLEAEVNLLFVTRLLEA